MTATLNTAVAFGSATIFAFGLGVGGLLDPAKILAFLDVAGPWNPGPLIVLGTAVVTYGVGYRLMRQPTPKQKKIDGRLISGAVLFGIGWGLAGLCPGPAFAGLAFGKTGTLTFVAAMVLGGLVYRIVHESAHLKSHVAPLGIQAGKSIDRLKM